MRKLTLLLIIAMFFSIISPMAALASQDLHYEIQAVKLNAINILRGSDKGYELDRELNRVEGSVMLVRLLGEEQNAVDQKHSHPFEDVPSWANDYVGFLYKNELTRGISASRFGSQDKMTAAQYTTFILRALGYDDSIGDFTWNQSIQKATSLGMITTVEQNRLTSKSSFLRDDMVGLSFFALKSSLKGISTTLAEKLAIDGAVERSLLVSAGFLSDGTKLEAKENMTVHFINVGQGDATLFIGPDFTILVDAGRHDKNDVVPYLQQLGVKHIDLLVGTHPHADHIGQIDKVLSAFSVSEVWLDGNVHTTLTFERVLDVIASTGANYYEPKAGEKHQIGSLHIDVINPTSLTGDLNNDSVGMRVQYGDISILLTGDIEKEVEAKMIEDKRPLEAQILKIGHHGSSSSSSQVFLDVINPQIGIYSAEKGNSYGHPHDEVIQRLQVMGITVYGTDIHGHIVITTDGKTYQVGTQVAGNIPVIEGSLPPKADKPNQYQPGNTTKININTASKEEIMEIIHINEVRAEELIRLRPFISVESLDRINGIGPARLADILEQGKAYVD